MELDKIKYHYFGEFGLLNTVILGLLTQYFNQYPNDILTIITYPDYCHILKLIFHNNIILEEYNTLLPCRLNHHEGKKKPKNIIDIKRHSIALNNYLTTKLKINPTIAQPNIYGYINIPISNQIQLQPNICVFPRNRKQESFRNMSSQQFNLIINICRKYHNNIDIIVLGHENETIELNNQNIIRISDIKNSITYLNNSKLFIASDSGYIDFAKNCGCPNIVLISNKKKIINYHFIFNPFNCIFNTITNIDTDINELSKFKELVCKL